MIRRVADANATVLIRGETGTGKELVARALHEMSGRRNEPFVAVNCSALPGTLIESLIFGHERGAFTGAERRTRGQLELAGGGTMLLDEIAEMPIDLQAKLLRVLEDRRFRPLGAEEERPLLARIVASTHVDLQRRIARGPLPRRPLLPAQRRHDPRALRSPSAPRTSPSSSRRSRPTWRESCASPRGDGLARATAVARQRARAAQRDRAHRASRRERDDRRADPRGVREPVRRGRRAHGDRQDGPLAPRPAGAARVEARRHRARHPSPRDRVVRRQQERRRAPHRRRPQGPRAPLGAAERRPRRTGQRPARQRRRQQGNR